MIIVSHHDIHETFISIFDTMLLAIFLDNTLDKRKFIKRDSREDVVFDLVLHTSADVVKEPVVEIDVSGGDDLMGEIVVDLVFGSTNICFSFEFLLSFVFVLSLVTSCDDKSGNGTSNKDSQSPDLPRQEEDVPGPVDSQTNHLLVVSLRNGPLNRVNLPFNLKDSV